MDQTAPDAAQSGPAGFETPLDRNGFARRAMAGFIEEIRVGRHVCDIRRPYALNAKDNFRFERMIVGWRSGDVLDLRRKR